MSRARVQLCAPLDQKLLRRMIADVGHVLVQPKLKGIHLWWDGSTLRSDEGNELPALAHLSRALAERHPGRALEGEAYRDGLTEAEINGLCHRAEPDHETPGIGLHIFDLIDPLAIADERLRELKRLDYGQGLHPVPQQKATSLGEVRGCLDQHLRAGYEGIVIRDPRALWMPGKHSGCMKWKPGGEDYYTLTEVRQGNGEMAGLAASLTMADREGNEFTVGGLALTRDQRRRLWELREKAKGRLGLVTYTGAGGEDGLEGAVFRRFWPPWPELSDGRPRMSFRIDLGPGS